LGEDIFPRRRANKRRVDLQRRSVFQGIWRRNKGVKGEGIIVLNIDVNGE